MAPGPPPSTRSARRTHADPGGDGHQPAQDEVSDLDPAKQAAKHFAHLVIGSVLDRGMFHHDVSLDAAALDARADRAVTVFLAGYGRADSPITR